MIEIIKPESQEHWLSLRTMDITSTEVASLFGLSPYATYFETWHRKKDATIIKLEENERMRWGSRLQNAIAQGIAEDMEWEIRLMDEYIRDSALRIGASFDFSIEQFTNPEVTDRGLLEIKNVDALIFRDGWSFDEDGDLEAPPHIELQVQHQLMLTGRPVCYIGALVGGNKVELIERRPDAAIASSIKEKVQEFWTSIEENRPPTPDFIRDAEFISQIYNYAEPNKVLDARNDSDLALWAMEYRRLGDEIKAMDAERDGYKARILTHMQDAEKVLGEDFTISAGVVAEAEIHYKRKPYRAFRCAWKKTKG